MFSASHKGVSVSQVKSREVDAPRPLFSACRGKNICGGYYEPCTWPLYISSDDNYRTHDLWIFIKPRPSLNLFKQIHYWLAGVAANTGSLPGSQPVHFQRQQWQRKDTWSRGRGGVSRGVLLTRDRIPESIYFHPWIQPQPFLWPGTLCKKKKKRAGMVLTNHFWLLITGQWAGTLTQNE